MYFKTYFVYFIHSLINSKSNELLQSLGCLCFDRTSYVAYTDTFLRVDGGEWRCRSYLGGVRGDKTIVEEHQK